MTAHVFLWLTLVLLLTVALLQSYHRRRVAAQIEAGIDDVKAILDSTSEGIITTDAAGVITRYNQAAEEIFGYRPDNVIGNSFLLLLPEDSHDAYRGLMSGTRPDGAGESLELMACRSDGARFPIALTVKSFCKNGEHVHLGTLRDISARKLAEVNSSRSQRFMEFLLQSSSTVFYTCDMKQATAISYVSPNVKDLLGYEPKAIVGSVAFWTRYVHPDERKYLQSSRVSLTGRERETIEYRVLTAAGDYRWIADSRIVVDDENGQPTLLIGCWTDIHDRKETESKLALKDERLRISLKCAKLTTWDWAIDDGTITWSGHVPEGLGLSEQAVIPVEDFNAMAHPKDSESLQSALRHCLVHDESLDIEYRMVWPDKSIHWIHLTGELLDDANGCPVRMVGVLNDISDQKQLRVAPVATVQAVS